jgi:type II secretory pathway component PulF
LTSWRYKARDPNTLEIVSNVIQADTDLAARSALRKAGLRPIQIKPVRATKIAQPKFSRFIERHLRSRRVHLKADFYDSMATLLDAGIPLSDALRTMASSGNGRRRSSTLAHLLADAIQSGNSLDTAMSEHGGWFDGAEIAMIRAGQQSGEMSGILRRLADRQSRSGELSSKITGALAYPLLVSCIGIGVTIFLSTNTLPQLVGILTDAGIETPALTGWVMGIGQMIWNHGVWILLAVGVLVIGGALIAGALSGLSNGRIPRLVASTVPSAFLRIRTSESLLSLSELLDTGVTLVDALRVVSPTLRGYLGRLLGQSFLDSATKIEQGQPISCIFEDPVWFAEEHRQLITAGEAAGDLSRTLERIGNRDLRSARRLIDRLAAMIEPAAIVCLAILIGTVVMAAVLPLIRLQEIVG